MNRARPILAPFFLTLIVAAPTLADDPPPVSFLKDVAPILVQNCIACHNPKKSESKYTMTTFALLAKGGSQGKGITLVPGDPDASYLRRALPARRRAPDAFQARAPAGREAGDHRALGQGRGEV